MKKEHIRTIQEASYFLGLIGKYIALLENTEELYIISYCSIDRFNIEDAIKIPKCLTKEFKQKLEAFFENEYSKYVNELKAIEL